MTQTLPPSLTPLPTISFDNAAGNFEVLLATNGGCRLPCFWGMAPGKTRVAEMNQFADRLPPDLVDIESHRYVIYYITRKTGDTSFAVNFLTDDNVLRSIHLGVDTARYYVTLPKLLNDYGMPTQVLIGPPMFEDWLSLLVLYEDQQFMGEYVLFPNKDDSSLYCFDPAFSPMDIVTWSPDQTWQDFIEQKEQSYQSLDEVSKYDILSFHETLRNDNRALCLEVQTDGIPK